MRCDEMRGGIEPDVAIEGALDVDQTVGEGDERGADVVAVCGENGVAFGDERREEAIAGRQPLADQRLGDGLGDFSQPERRMPRGERAGGRVA